ncbi:hypothetical protein JZ751_022239 [Albula glossodonta]|uniref:Uncharacterized protein n=1 Tax=Albula glossodonta TaxID=121402 RepID=A0A8T2NJQ9_9TELE|nr:hypothetical protein JZ751_022239 [Albula glossodonta]
MEERQYASLTVPTDYLQHWFPSTPHIQAQQVMHYHQMTDDAYFMDAPDRVMTEMMVHQEPHIPQGPPAPMPGYSLPPYGTAPESNGHHIQPLPQTSVHPITPTEAKRGRPPSQEAKAKQEKGDEGAVKVKRKLDRFNGMSPEEVMTKTLPDILAYNLDMLILNHMHDQSLPEKYGIGFTNMVERTTPGSKDLSNQELREGGRILVEKVCYLMPSSSPRCSQFPRAQDKVHFFLKLKELRDQLKEDAKKTAIKEEKQDPGYEESFSGGCGKSEQEARQSNGHCSFSFPQTHAGHTVPNMEATPQTTSSARVLDGQWMMQSFADQIPDIAGSGTPQPH